MTKKKWMALASLTALLSAAAVWGGDSNQETPKTTEDTGRFVDHDTALQMGGVGNYVTPEEARRYDKKIAEQEDLRRKVASSEKQLPPVAEASPDQGVVFFQTDKADLTPDGKAEISSISKELKQDSNLAIEVNGFTDSVGPSKYNQKLSDQRADAVKSELLAQGVSTDQIRTYGFGENEPIASNDTRSGRAVNRRAEIYVENQTETG